jgi:hypothetical protein
MVNKEALQEWMVEGRCDPNEDVDTLMGLVRIYYGQDVLMVNTQEH